MASFVRVGEELPHRASASTVRQEGWAEKDRNRREDCAEYLCPCRPKKAMARRMEADTTLES